MCDKSFTEYTNLSHVKFHSCIKLHTCSVCGKGFTQKDSLRSHMWLHSEEKPSIYSNCGKGYTENTGVMMHLKHCSRKLVDGDDDDGCEVIQTDEDIGEQGITFSNVGKGLIANDDTVTQVSDGSVTKTGEYIRKIDQTWSVCTNKFTINDEKPDVWSICTKGFSIRGDSSLACYICHKYFMCESELKFHMSVHSQEKTYTCNMRDKPHKDEISLKEPELLDVSEKLYSCTVCDKIFPDISTLKLHAKAHSNVKPHTCSVCLKKFSKKGTLQRHMLIHSSERSFICSTCGNGFKLKEHLTRHVKTHLTHVCKLCHLAFKSDSKLRKHMKVHRSEKYHVCCVCGQCFNDGAVHEKHVASHSCKTSTVIECNDGSELDGLGDISDTCSQEEDEGIMEENNVAAKKTLHVEDGNVKVENHIPVDDNVQERKTRSVVTEPINSFVKDMAKAIKEESDIVVEDYPMIDDHSLYFKEEIPSSSSTFYGGLENMVHLYNTIESNDSTIVNFVMDK